jgi:sugar/nucleoside kinase (ribokinase family)
MLTDIDLLVLNADEAAAFTGGNDRSGADLVRHSIERLLAVNDRLSIVITAGVSGSWSWNGDTTQHVPAVLAPVRSTAGAGDAHHAGILSGLTLGASLHEANRFASLISSMKVGSPHTINPEISWATVRSTAAEIGFPLPAGSAWPPNGDQ